MSLEMQRLMLPLVEEGGGTLLIVSWSVSAAEAHVPYTHGAGSSNLSPTTKGGAMKFEYHEVYEHFVHEMNALLARAQKGDAGVMDDYRSIKADFDTKVAAGFVDWEGDIARHLKMLEIWCKRAEPTPP